MQFLDFLVLKPQVLLLVLAQLSIYEVYDLQQVSHTLDVYVRKRLSLYYSSHSPTHHQTCLVYVSGYLTL